MKIAAGFTLSLVFALFTSAGSADEAEIGIAKALPVYVQETLHRMPDTGRRLLALRSYLRAESIGDRWSLDQAQIENYLKSDTYIASMAAVAGVVKAFELKNPGYSLRVNTDIRSLDDQIEKWNTNVSVQEAGKKFAAAFERFRSEQPNLKPDDIRSFLKEWSPVTAPALAAPGLSLHGRGMAFDFQVTEAGKVIAGADTASIAEQWVAKGWSVRLAEAVRVSATPFVGPLKSPDEPWHYDYKPTEMRPAAANVESAKNPDSAMPPVAVPIPSDRPVKDERTPETAKPARSKTHKAKQAISPKAKAKAKAITKRRQKSLRSR